MLFHILDLTGVAVFAVTGALEARRRQMDVFGACVVGFVTALGGGTLRDLLLGRLLRTPVFWVADWSYVAVAAAASIVTFCAFRPRRSGRRFLLIADAAGLAMATMIGVTKSLSAGVSPVVALVMGTVTGVVGGIARDVLCNEVPLVLREDIYATVCLVGGLLYLALRTAGAPFSAAILSAVTVMFAFRVAAIVLRLRLPAGLRGAS